jgi:hypothetical protein
MHRDHSDPPRSSENGTPSSREMIAERTVVSRPHAAVEVTVMRLTEGARRGLSTGQKKLDNVK